MDLKAQQDRAGEAEDEEEEPDEEVGRYFMCYISCYRVSAADVLVVSVFSSVL
jgi:hypothetical protein